MLKFQSKQDIQMLLLEIGRQDLIPEVKDTTYQISDDLMERFIKQRRGFGSKIKSFRKSQAAKENWRRNRHSMMKGIRGYHKSTEGKRFHRSLGRFLANRNMNHGEYKRESFDPVLVHEVSEVLKGLSSLVTHLYIENEYFKSVDEQVDLEILMEEAVPAIHRIEQGILNSQEIKEEDLDILIRLVNPKDLIQEISTHFGRENTEVNSLFQESEAKIIQDGEGSYLALLNKVKLGA